MDKEDEILCDKENAIYLACRTSSKEGISMNKKLKIALYFILAIAFVSGFSFGKSIDVKSS